MAKDPKNHWHTVEPGSTSSDINGFGMVNGHFRVTFMHKGKHSEYQYTTDEKDICCNMAMSTSIGRFFERFVRPLPYAKLS